MSLTPQQRLVLKALAKGSAVTKLTALHQKIGNIFEVVRKIKKAGWDVRTLYSLDLNGDQYVKYELVDYQRGAAREYTTVSRLTA